MLPCSECLPQFKSDYVENISTPLNQQPTSDNTIFERLPLVCEQHLSHTSISNHPTSNIMPFKRYDSKTRDSKAQGDRLSALVSSMFEADKFSDLTIKCQGTIFRVHRLVVCLQSKPLATAVDGRWKVISTLVPFIVRSCSQTGQPLGIFLKTP